MRAPRESLEIRGNDATTSTIATSSIVEEYGYYSESGEKFEQARAGAREISKAGHV
jgi:hypothetical protein